MAHGQRPDLKMDMDGINKVKLTLGWLSNITLGNSLWAALILIALCQHGGCRYPNRGRAISIYHTNSIRRHGVPRIQLQDIYRVTVKVAWGRKSGGFFVNVGFTAPQSKCINAMINDILTKARFLCSAQHSQNSLTSIFQNVKSKSNTIIESRG